MSFLNKFFLFFKTYVYVNILTIHITFFAVSAILGIKHLGSEESSAYKYTLLASSIFSYLFIFIDLVRYRVIYKSSLIFFLVPFFLVFFYIVGGSYEDFANKTLLLFFTLVLPSMLAGYLIARDESTDKLLKGILIASFIILLGLTRTLSDLISAPIYDLLTIFGGGQYQALSYFAAFGYATFLAYSLFYKNNTSLLLNIFIVSALSIFLAGIILSGGRGGMVVVFFVSILFFYIKYGLKKLLIALIGITIILSLTYQVILTIEFESKERLLQSFERLFSYISKNGIDMSQTSERDDFYAQSLSLIKKRLLLGYGVFGYVQYTGAFYSHNLFLDFLLHGGLLYLFAWILFFTYFTIRLFFILKFNPKEVIILVPVLCSFTLLLFSGSYLQESMFWFSLAFVLNYQIKNEMNPIDYE